MAQRLLHIFLLLITSHAYCEERGEKPIAPPAAPEPITKEMANKFFKARCAQIEWPETVTSKTISISELPMNGKDKQLTALALVETSTIRDAQVIVILSGFIIGEAIKEGVPIKRAMVLITTPNGVASVVIPRSSALLLTAAKGNLAELGEEFLADCAWDSINEISLVEKNFPSVKLEGLDKDKWFMEYLKKKSKEK